MTKELFSYAISYALEDRGLGRDSLLLNLLGFRFDSIIIYSMSFLTFLAFPEDEK